MWFLRTRQFKTVHLEPKYVERADYLLIRDSLPEYLYGVITFAYTYGCRFSEILNLTWEDVDRDLWKINMNRMTMGGDIKRTIILNDELKIIFSQLWEERLKKNKIYVFLNSRKTSKINNFRREFNRAFKKTTVNRFNFYDLRRTSVINMLKAGYTARQIIDVNGYNILYRI